MTASALIEPTARSSRGEGVRLFTAAAARYWLGVFPVVRSAQRRLLARAEAIPDPRLRADALASHRDKGSNSEGLAALAVLAARPRRVHRWTAPVPGANPSNDTSRTGCSCTDGPPG